MFFGLLSCPVLITGFRGVARDAGLRDSDLLGDVLDLSRFNLRGGGS